MKIQINQEESYQIEMPEEVSSQQFLGLLMRLEKIGKLLNKEIDFNSSQSENLKQRKNLAHTLSFRRNRHQDFRQIINGNRNEIIKIIKSYYGDKKYIEELEQKYGINLAYLTYVIKDSKKKYSITPSEVGLKHFPTRRDPIRNRSFLKDLHLENATTNN